MIKSKPSASSIIVSSIFVIHLMNDAQFGNGRRAAVFPTIVILPFIKMYAS